MRKLIQLFMTASWNAFSFIYKVDDYSCSISTDDKLDHFCWQTENILHNRKGRPLEDISKTVSFFY